MYAEAWIAFDGNAKTANERVIMINRLMFILAYFL